MEHGASGGKQSAMYKETRDGEEIQYQGYTNPRKQSRTFHMLEHGLGISDGTANDDPGVYFSSALILRTISVPVFVMSCMVLF